MINLTEAVQKIKAVGTTNVRVVPMSGQPMIGGMHQIEIKEAGSWIPIVSGIPKMAAEDVVRQASSRVLFG